MTDRGFSRSRRFPWYGWIGLSSLMAGQLGLMLGVFWVRVLFYCIAWWSYILIADAQVWKRQGHSLLRNRPWEFLVLAFWSVPIWNLFEVFNFRLQNWFYVNVPTSLVFGLLFTIFAYATVVPGLFETYDLLRAHGVIERARMQPWRNRQYGILLAVLIGLAMLCAPLIWPRYAFPLIWGFAVFLVDPLCFRWGASPSRSLLGQFERGDPRPFLRLLLAGLVCGALWEFWNSWAHTKWLYTVPFFQDIKWFEMPPLGFLGFPPFALEAYVLINFINLFRRGRGWEEPSQTGPGVPLRTAVACVVAALLFNVLVYRGIDRFTVQSYSPALDDMEGIPGEVLHGVTRLGVKTPDALLRRTATPQELTSLARQAAISEEQLRALHAAARLVDLKGLGAAHYNALRRLGITRIEDLASQEPETLTERWRAITDRKRPSLRQVKVWVRAARQHSRSPRSESP